MSTIDPAGREELRQRDPRLIDTPYKGAIAKLLCPVCMRMGRYNNEVQVAHVSFADADAGWRGSGMQEKAHDRLCVPLCQPHHTGDSRKVKVHQHGMNEREWWEAEGFDIIQLVKDLNEVFDERGPLAIGWMRGVIIKHAARARSRVRHA